MEIPKLRAKSHWRPPLPPRQVDYRVNNFLKGLWGLFRRRTGKHNLTPHQRQLLASLQFKADAWRKFLSGRRFVADDCPIEFEQKKIDLDAYINGTLPSRLQRRKFYGAMAVGVTSKATAAAMAAVAAAAAGAVLAMTTTTMTTMTMTTMVVAAAVAMTMAAATLRRWRAHTTINLKRSG